MKPQVRPRGTRSPARDDGLLVEQAALSLHDRNGCLGRAAGSDSFRTAVLWMQKSRAPVIAISHDEIISDSPCCTR